jgi:hypothetical protein
LNCFSALVLVVSICRVFSQAAKTAMVIE